jgi:hypothetical protein
MANEREPFLLVECKLNEEQPASALLAAPLALRVPAVQLVRDLPGDRKFTNDGLPVLVAPACQWCAGLP